MSDKTFQIGCTIAIIIVVAVILFSFYIVIARWIDCRQYYGVPAGDVPAQCIGRF